MPAATPQILISATFTAEPVEPTLGAWSRALEIDSDVQFAPFNQLFPQLLDGDSEFAKNERG